MPTAKTQPLETGTAGNARNTLAGCDLKLTVNVVVMRNVRCSLRE